ncbi:MAG TPA: hypothetical protein VF289_15570 [Brachybacterium sp.]
MHEQTAHHDAHLVSVGAEAVARGILRLGERIAQLLAHGFRRDRPVPLDMGDVAVVRAEQGTVGDHHSEVEGHRFHPVLPAEQGVGEGVSHQRGVTVPRAACPPTLGLEGEPLVGELRVESGQVSAHGGHAVLTRDERHMTLRACSVMAVGGAVRVELVDGMGDDLPPPFHPGAIHPWHLFVEHLVDLPALQVIQRRRGGSCGVRDGRRDLPSSEGGEHPGHGSDQAPR